MIKSRSASVVYECVYSIITGGMLKEEYGESDRLSDICLERLLAFLSQSDQNLKYLGLNALSRLLQFKPEIGPKHREIILKCLEDGDISIRSRALELVSTLVNSKSLFGIVKKLVVHLTSHTGLQFAGPEVVYRSKVVETIVQECSKDSYANLSNFEWYIGVLCDLALFSGLNSQTALLLQSQILDVCVRVPEVRDFAIITIVIIIN